MSAERERTLTKVAAWCAALVFVVVAASAWLRLAAGATACPAGGCEEFGIVDAIRLVHRLAAMGVTVLALLIAALAWKAPSRPVLRLGSVLVLVLVVMLTVLGRSSSGSPSTGVVLGNLLGGLALLALCAGLATFARASTLGAPSFVPWLPVVATALLALAIVLGAIVTASAAPEGGLAASHRLASWAALITWAYLAADPRAAPGASFASRLTGGTLAVMVALALAAPQSDEVKWLHNLLAAASICFALAACAPRPRPPIGEPPAARH